MKLFFIFATALLVSASLEASDWSCRPLSYAPCALEMCLGTVPGYSATVVVLKPNEMQRLRVHLHGFSETGSPPRPMNAAYDWNNSKYPTPEAARAAFSTGASDSPERLVRAFGMERSCLNKEVVIVPLSRGHCTTYKAHFKSAPDLQQLIDRLGQALHLPQTLPLTLSGHSGAGKVLQALLQTDELKHVNRIVAYDAFYSVTEAQALKDWVKRQSGRQLHVISLQTGAPQSFAQQVFGAGDARIRNKKTLVSEGLDHWSLVKKYWND